MILFIFLFLFNFCVQEYIAPLYFLILLYFRPTDVCNKDILDQMFTDYYDEVYKMLSSTYSNIYYTGGNFNKLFNTNIPVDKENFIKCDAEGKIYFYKYNNDINIIYNSDTVIDIENDNNIDDLLQKLGRVDNLYYYIIYRLFRRDFYVTKTFIIYGNGPIIKAEYPGSDDCSSDFYDETNNEYKWYIDSYDCNNFEPIVTQNFPFVTLAYVICNEEWEKIGGYGVIINLDLLFLRGQPQPTEEGFFLWSDYEGNVYSRGWCDVLFFMSCQGNLKDVNNNFTNLIEFINGYDEEITSII